MIMSGRELSVIQDQLAKDWNKHGPDIIYKLRISSMNRETLEQLVMANLGKRAQDLANA
jgi:hypothetical protein